MQGNEGYGVAAFVLNLAKGIRQLNWEPVIVSLADGQFVSRCRDEGFETVILGVERAQKLTGSLPRRVLTYVMLLLRQRRISHELEQSLRQIGPDVIHFAWPNLLGLCGAVGKRLGLPILWEMPNYVSDTYPFGLNRRIYQWQCKHFGIQPLADSAYTASTLGDHPVNPIVFYHCVDSERFDPEVVHAIERNELGIPDHAIVLGIVARLHSTKGQDLVLRAMLALSDQDPPLHLLLIGGPLDGPLAIELRGILEHSPPGSMHDPKRMHLLGPVTDPQRYYGIIDIGINCRIDPEPFGISVVEAMLMGKPVLVHALGGPAETVIDGVTGWHVHEPTVSAFVQGLRRALGERSSWVEMGQAGRQRALEHFATYRQAVRYQAIVEQTISRAKT